MRDTNAYVVLGIGVVLAAATLLRARAAHVVSRRSWQSSRSWSCSSVGPDRGVHEHSPRLGSAPPRARRPDHSLPRPARLVDRPRHAARSGTPPAGGGSRPYRHRRVGGRSGRTRDRQFRQYSLWVKNEGARTYIEWLATHPTYTLFESFESPERVHLRRTVTDYSPDANEVPLITRLFFWPWPAAVAAFVVLLGVGIWRRRVRDVTWLVALGLVVLAVPHLLIAWHGDARVPHPPHAARQRAGDPRDPGARPGAAATSARRRCVSRRA